MRGYKSIMVHVTTEEDASARIALAVDLAEQFDAHLIGLGAGCINVPAYAMDDGTAAAILLEVEDKNLQSDLQAAEARFFSMLKQGSVKAEWRAFTDFPADVLAREARSADVVILGHEWTASSAGISCAANPGDVLLRAGRPILLVPPKISQLAASRVLIAWKDTREARRAVMDALPILCGAEQVNVVEICEDDRDQEAAASRAKDVARYLVRHGIGAEGSASLLRESSVSAQIALAARQQGADLIVSGGYGHARLQEWVFGGMTRDLLRHSELCCLLSH